MNNILDSKNLLLAGKYLLYATTITPLIVLSNFLFPYISTRTVYFRSLIEILLIIFLLIFLKATVKIKAEKNYFLPIFLFFVIANIISGFFSFSILIAWFSDTERMWGIFTLIHLFLFYIFLRSFFSGREWKVFLNISLVISLIVAFYGLAQYYPEIFKLNVFQAGKSRIISTLGNSAYVAIYMLFNIFFALFLLTKTKNNWLKLFYASVMLVDFYAFNLANIRGTAIGLLVGATITALLYVLLGENKKIKIVIATGLVIIPSLIFFAILNPTSKFTKSSALLERLATIDLQGGTTETRLIGWRAALLGFKEHPIFGVGMDNYNTVFNKYFDANYYLFAPSEPYFDRSHNAILDVLVMNGIVGFIIFLGFPFFIFYYLIKGYRKEKIKIDEFLIFLSLTIAYFIHLIFVFDDLNSYIYFVILLAFVEYRYHKNNLLEVQEVKEKIDLNKGVIVLILIFIIIIVGYNFNIKVIKAGGKAVAAMGYGNDITGAVAVFGQAFDYNIVPSRNVTLAYINYVTNLGNSLQAISKDEIAFSNYKKALDKAFIVLNKEIKKDSYNAILYNRLAVLNNLAFLSYRDPIYVRASIEAGMKSIELSEQHLQYYYTLADTYIISGNSSEAINVINRAIEINSEYTVSYFFLAKTYLADKQLDKAMNTAKSFIKQGYIPTSYDFFIILANEYENNLELDKSIEALELGNELSKGKDTAILVKLIKTYLTAGQNDKAINTAERLKEINEELSKDADYIINKIRRGEVEELLKTIG